MEYKYVDDVNNKSKEDINSCKIPKKSNKVNDKHAERKIFTKKEKAKK